MQAWGTSTVLIETGILSNDRQKQELRRLNIVALLTAFEAIASERYADEATAAYDSLPMNRSVDYSVLVRGGDLVLEGAAPIQADIALYFDDSAAGTGPRYGEIGDLEGASKGQHRPSNNSGNGQW